MTTRSKVAVALYALAALVAASCVLAGCIADRYIPVSVPQGIQMEMAVPASVSLREAPHLRESYVLKAKQNVESLDGNIEDGLLIMDIVSTGTGMGITALQGASATVPGGALMVGGLTTLAALFTRRPGDKHPEDVIKEKEGSYAKGAKDAEARIKEQLMALGIRLGERAANRAVDNVVDGVTK